MIDFEKCYTISHFNSIFNGLYSDSGGRAPVLSDWSHLMETFRITHCVLHNTHECLLQN